ncbi:UNVERIFIED_ORG: hypothetical protein CLV66_110188 [Actinomadura viridilutea]
MLELVRPCRRGGRPDWAAPLDGAGFRRIPLGGVPHLTSEPGASCGPAVFRGRRVQEAGVRVRAASRVTERPFSYATEYSVSPRAAVAAVSVRRTSKLVRSW